MIEYIFYYSMLCIIYLTFLLPYNQSMTMIDHQDHMLVNVRHLLS